MSFRHDAGIFRPNGVSRRTLNGMETPNPRCFGVWGVIGKKFEAKKSNRVSAKCAIHRALCLLALCLVYLDHKHLITTGQLAVDMLYTAVLCWVACVDGHLLSIPAV
jgi:hypothetical protein